MLALALAIVLAFALWLAMAGVGGLFHPMLAREWIGRFATSLAVNLTELAWRGLAGPR